MKTELALEQVAPGARKSVRARWMVVDDDAAVLEFLASQLETIGIADVCRCQSGAEAFAAFAAAPDKFQFVVTDLDMPGINGIELCRRLRAVAPGLKVVLATGSGVANEAGVRQCGFSGLLAKPFSAAQLWRTLKAAGVLNPTTLTANT